jgi:hypothetical protein
MENIRRRKAKPGVALLRLVVRSVWFRARSQRGRLRASWRAGRALDATVLVYWVLVRLQASFNDMEHVCGHSSWKPASTLPGTPVNLGSASHRVVLARLLRALAVSPGCSGISDGTPESFAPVNSAQHPPCTNQLLNSGGWREHFAGVSAISVGRLVNSNRQRALLVAAGEQEDIRPFFA